MLKTEAILPAAQVRETAKGKPKHIFSRALPYLMVAPSLTIFSVFVLYPIFYMIYLSFFKWNMIGPKTFIGLKMCIRDRVSIPVWRGSMSARGTLLANSMKSASV